MKVKPQTAIIIVLLIFIAGITVAQATGIWSIKSNNNSSGKFKEIAVSGEADPADIRGSYTFSDVSRIFNIPIEDLAKAFGVDEKLASDIKCSELKNVYGDLQLEIGTGSVEMFTAYYLGLSYAPKEETYLLASAVQILKERGKMTQSQLDYVESHTVFAD